MKMRLSFIKERTVKRNIENGGVLSKLKAEQMPSQSSAAYFRKYSKKSYDILIKRTKTEAEHHKRRPLTLQCRMITLTQSYRGGKLHIAQHWTEL